MNAHTSLWLALPIALLVPFGALGFVGCNNAAGTEGAPDTLGDAPAVEAPAAEASAAQHARRHGHHARGPANVLLHAAKSLDLGADQRATVDAIAADLRGDRGAMRAAQQALHAALAAGVRAGNVDLARLAPLEAAVDAAHAAHAAREARALDGLYAALQPAQRQALVAAVRERKAEHAGRWAGHHEGQRETGAGRLAHLTSQLGLDASQQQRVSVLTATEAQATTTSGHARHEAARARMDALLTAFAGDAFVAKELDLASPEAGAGRGRHAAFLSQLVPILRADQRETLAASMTAKRHG